MNKTLEFILFGVIGAGLVSATITEIQGNGETQYSKLTESTSFWFLIFEIIAVSIYYFSKKTIKNKIEEQAIIIKEEISEKIKKSIINDLESKLKKEVTQQVLQDIKAQNQKEIKDIRYTVKDYVERRVEDFADKRLVPLVINEVHKELEKVQGNFNTQIELSVLRYTFNQRTQVDSNTSNQQISYEQLLTKVEHLIESSNLSKVGAE